MQFPEDWSHKQRSGVVVNPASNGSSSNPNALRPPRNISSSELDTFAREASVHHVNVNSLFMRSVSNDTGSVIERILALLPDDEAQASTGAAEETISVHTNSSKRKGPGPSTAKVKRARGTSSTRAGTNSEASDSATSIAPNEKFSRCDMRLELDTLLSRLPYKRMMQDMIPHGGEGALHSVPYVTRIYEEGYMREPISTNERACVMGEECECMCIDKNNAFVGVEFVVPGEEPTSTPQMCVLCSRAATQQLYYDIVFDATNFNGMIQRYGNLHNIMNEYAQEAVLICPPNGPLHAMPLPIMSHQRNRYSVTKVGGIRYIRQHGVYFQ